MGFPQPGIFALGTASHAYLEFDVRPGYDVAATVARVASLREPRTTIGGVNLVAGFRPSLWAAVAPDAAIPGLTGFDSPIVGPADRTMPATQHDVVTWITGASYDVVFDLSRQILAGLTDELVLVDEEVGWPYHHDLDLTGFIDGTENPNLVEAMGVAVVPDGSPGAGGSVLLLQRWEHDVPAWEGLPTEAQEAVIGRRKSDSEELDPVPPDSHVGRTDQDRFGRIFRRNIAYGTVRRHGTLFVGFCASQAPLVAMLESMVGAAGSPPGSEPADALMRFARPLTGAFYAIPSVDRLAAFGPAADD